MIVVPVVEQLIWVFELTVCVRISPCAVLCIIKGVCTAIGIMWWLHSRVGMYVHMLYLLYEHIFDCFNMLLRGWLLEVFGNNE